MGDYQQSTTVAAEPERLYAYLSDVENLPRYFAAMRSAEPAGGEAVHTVAEVGGQSREGEAWFRKDDEAHSIRWGAEGGSNYSGQLMVIADDAGSLVTVELHTEHVDGGAIENGLRETLANIKENVEDGADPKAP